METSRGCPYHCTFCAKDNFRDTFRRRPLEVIAKELDGLVAAGIEYVYFIDEIFLPFAPVLETIAARRIKFGIQTRIDLWNHQMIDLLGRAGCVSIEAGVESITESGRARLAKKCKLSTDEITDRLLYAKQRVAFVQANLLDCQSDDPEEVEQWRQRLQEHGVWANKPVPLFPYPGSPDYTRRWGMPDDRAWERAHDFYLGQFDEFSDIQEQRPASLIQLETQAPAMAEMPLRKVLLTGDNVGGVWSFASGIGGRSHPARHARAASHLRARRHTAAKGRSGRHRRFGVARFRLQAGVDGRTVERRGAIRALGPATGARVPARRGSSEHARTR